jgi:hypothetical protein
LYRNWLAYLKMQKEKQASHEPISKFLQGQSRPLPDLVAANGAVLSVAPQAPSTAATDSRSILTIL